MKILALDGAALLAWWYPPSATVEFMAAMTVIGLAVVETSRAIQWVAEAVESWQNSRV